MQLAAHQRKLLDLIRSGRVPDRSDDPYIQRVAASDDLKEAQRNIFLWRVYVLERTAPLTFTVLKQRELLRSAIGEFIGTCNVSPFRETQAPAFLDLMSRHDDSLVASVAQFELAFLRVRQGDAGHFVVRWNFEPTTILNELARGLPVSIDAPRGDYQVVISRELPYQFKVISPPSAHVAASPLENPTRCAVASLG